MAVAGFENAEQEAKRRRSFLTDPLWMEKYHPVLCAVGIAAIAHRFGLLIPGPEALGAFVGFSAAVAGFAATLLGILFSSKGLWKVRELEAAGKFDILKGYVYAPDFCLSHWGLLCCPATVLSLVGASGRRFGSAWLYIPASVVIEPLGFCSGFYRV